MPVTVDGAKPKAWEQQVKSFVRKRYAHLAEADAFPEGGADRARGAGYPARFIDGLPGRVASSYCGCGYLLDGVDLGGVRAAVELGCGAGLDARLLSERLGAEARLYAMDFAPRMLHRAREAFEGSRGGAHLHLLAGDMENIPLADGVADIVLANASFNLTVDKRRALCEAHRILKPGGRLAARELIREGELPVEIARDPQAWNASLGGVVEEAEWESLLAGAGFCDIDVSGHAPFRPVVSVRIHARKAVWRKGN
ncbi:MAG: methyltransferase domain-containing protein [Nitrospinae bacterium]|nr:methyltransferase domain-containing protein [Nitrospinota bacterium]